MKQEKSDKIQQLVKILKLTFKDYTEEEVSLAISLAIPLEILDYSTQLVKAVTVELEQEYKEYQ